MLGNVDLGLADRFLCGQLRGLSTICRSLPSFRITILYYAQRNQHSPWRLPGLPRASDSLWLYRPGKHPFQFGFSSNSLRRWYWNLSVCLRSGLVFHLCTKFKLGGGWCLWNLHGVLPLGTGCLLEPAFVRGLTVEIQRRERAQTAFHCRPCRLTRHCVWGSVCVSVK